MRDWMLAVLLLVNDNSVEHNLGVTAAIVAVAVLLRVSKGTDP